MRAPICTEITRKNLLLLMVCARFSGFSKEYITQLLTEYISPEVLVLE